MFMVVTWQHLKCHNNSAERYWRTVFSWPLLVSLVLDHTSIYMLLAGARVRTPAGLKVDAIFFLLTGLHSWVWKKVANGINQANYYENMFGVFSNDCSRKLVLKNTSILHVGTMHLTLGIFEKFWNSWSKSSCFEHLETLPLTLIRNDTQKSDPQILWGNTLQVDKWLFYNSFTLYFMKTSFDFPENVLWSVCRDGTLFSKSTSFKILETESNFFQILESSWLKRETKNMIAVRVLLNAI
jgi:hypothetical protein